MQAHWAIEVWYKVIYLSAAKSLEFRRYYSHNCQINQRSPLSAFCSSCLGLQNEPAFGPLRYLFEKIIYLQPNWSLQWRKPGGILSSLKEEMSMILQETRLEGFWSESYYSLFPRLRGQGSRTCYPRFNLWWKGYLWRPCTSSTAMIAKEWNGVNEYQSYRNRR